MHTGRPKIRFDPHTASADEILTKARQLEGKPLYLSVPSAPVEGTTDARTKGKFGGYLENYFDIPPNNDSRPDFHSAGIELKSVPIIEGKTGPTAKERTVIAQVNYKRLADEEWAHASVRKKLEKVLFVYYNWRFGVAAGTFVVRRVHLWSPDAEDLDLIARDWAIVQDKVRQGNAHLVSEGDGRILGACTKSADSTVLVEQPRSDVRAKPRAWALKAAFSGSILRELESGPAEISLNQTLPKGPREEFEDATLATLHRHKGKTLGELSAEFGLKIGAGKSAAAGLIRSILDVPARGRIREFERFGIEIKTVPLSPLGKAYEAISFPNFNHMELALDEWEGSALQGQLNRLLILPIIREQRRSPKIEHRVGRAFLWSPTDQELEHIAREWEMFRAKIAAGLAERLPKPSSTTYVHVRTKGKDSRDREPAPGATTSELLNVTKKCFWLNKKFIERIVVDSGALPTGSRM